MIDILLAVIITAVLTTLVVRYIDKMYEKILVIEAYLLGIDDILNHATRKTFEEIIEKVETNLRNKINKKGE